MAYLTLVYLHLATVVPAFLIGTWLLFNRKGTTSHRLLGQVFMLLMLGTAVLALFISNGRGSRLFGHFGFIHLFVIPVVLYVPRAYFAARRGDIRTHRRCMVGVYVGALLIAGGFALAPGRLLHHWLFESTSHRLAAHTREWKS